MNNPRIVIVDEHAALGVLLNHMRQSKVWNWLSKLEKEIWRLADEKWNKEEKSRKDFLALTGHYDEVLCEEPKWEKKMSSG